MGPLASSIGYVTYDQANTQGTQGWELSGVAVDTNRPDKYVGFLKRKKQVALGGKRLTVEYRATMAARHRISQAVERHG
jgi:hypothetical protein